MEGEVGLFTSLKMLNLYLRFTLLNYNQQWLCTNHGRLRLGPTGF